MTSHETECMVHIPRWDEVDNIDAIERRILTDFGAPCPNWAKSDGECCPSRTHEIYCTERMRFVGEIKRRHEEPIWSRHFIACAILFMSIAFLGAVALGVVGQARHYRYEVAEGRV